MNIQGLNIEIRNQTCLAYKSQQDFLSNMTTIPYKEFTEHLSLVQKLKQLKT